MKTITEAYDFTGRSIVVTGGTGVLGKEIVFALSSCGANLAILTRDPSRAKGLMNRLKTTSGHSILISGDVLKKESLEKAAEEAVHTFGKIDCLINGAGGNNPKATTNPQQSFFQLSEEGLRYVSDLNLLGTILPCQVIGKLMAEKKQGVILNISSMNAFRPLTRIPAYSAAKAAVTNFTQWLAVHMAQEYSPNIRVNAIAPGFFLTEQNQFLLKEKETGALTERGKKIIEHTPLGRFGNPEDLIGAVLWLLSPAASFVTGVVLPVDGGFSAFSGV
jgi:NAD(P)-dependent dehydrogenase (short-subunit alcohol dehydrogenase family)